MKVGSLVSSVNSSVSSSVKLGLLVAAVVLISRLMPHPPNMTATTVGILAFARLFQGLGVPALWVMGVRFVGDLVIGLYWVMPFVYLAEVLGLWIARLGLKARWLKMPTALLLVNLSFFVISNFGEWLMSPLYPKTLGGLSTCFVNALPFWRHSLVGDAAYLALFMSAEALYLRWNGATSKTSQQVAPQSPKI